jgi:hypothetical protein
LISHYWALPIYEMIGLPMAAVALIIGLPLVGMWAWPTLRRH